jgi:predicted metalloprotease
MKRLMIVLTVLFVFSISAFAQMRTGQDGGMMGGGWGWGMGYGWGFGVIIVILVVVVVVYMMKRK